MKRRVPLFILLASALIAGAIVLLRSKPEDTTTLPTKNPDLYRRMVSAFTVAVVRLKVGDNLSRKKLGASLTEEDRKALVEPYVQPTRLVPGEPAAWANLALYYLRTPTPADAESPLKRAKDLAPEDSRIEMLLGALAKSLSKPDEALAHFRRAVNMKPSDPRIRFALISQLSSTQSGPTDQELLANWKEIAVIQPDNVRAQLETAVAAARIQKPDDARIALDRIKRIASTWPPDTRKYFDDSVAAAAGSDTSALLPKVMVALNVAKATLAFRQGSLALLPTVAQSGDSSGVADPIEEFIRLPNPSRLPAASDMGMTLTARPSELTNSGAWSFARSLIIVPELVPNRAQADHLPPTPEGSAIAITANSNTVQLSNPGKSITLPFPGRASQAGPTPDGLLFTDWSYHFREDIVMAGAGGLRFYVQQQDSTFKDVTGQTQLPAEILSAAWTGAWPIDVECDGDLDIVLGSGSGEPTVLRNNGNKTFQVTHPFKGVSGLRDFAWGDLDGDGDGDVAIIDGHGKLQLFENQRGGVFTEWLAPSGIKDAVAVAIADVDHDGILDIAVFQADGIISRVSRNKNGNGWDIAEILRTTPPPSDGTARLLWADLDNNGGADLIATSSKGTEVWLSDPVGALKPLTTLPDLRNASLSEPTKEGRIDLVGVTPTGGPVRYINAWKVDYHWHIIRPRSQPLANDTSNKEGDKRINSFGIGGTADMRSGLLAQTVPICGPSVHFGLGENTSGDALRINWPNGKMNGYFALPSGSFSTADQNLGGSCPWLFAWNGRKMEFVTDILWSSPLGLRINAQGTAPVGRTVDWVNVLGRQLVPRNGTYDLSITAELWETHFFDMVKLMTVDHPEGTEVFVDERFSVPLQQPILRVLKPVQRILHAMDERGNDVTSIVRDKDGNYLDTFGLGEYQGITQDHYVEVDLGNEPADLLPKRPRTFVVAYGWTHPTDSSINVAISQGSHDLPRDISIEIPDGVGGWNVALPHEGFPAGKNKTILFDITGLFSSGMHRKLRLRTNLEVYWDFIGYAESIPDLQPATQVIDADVAVLRYRGYSQVSDAHTSSPEIPDYNNVVATGPKWLDLVGYYTRFGDVRELLGKVDDRYVILNAGDEIALRFKAPPDPPKGWKRDFVFVSDGWEKDGNFNTGFGQTVLPLPSHDNPTYAGKAGRLEDDPVYRRHPDDWRVYHTRYVQPTAIRTGLRPSPSH